MFAHDEVSFVADSLLVSEPSEAARPFAISARASNVELWSTIRLPFDRSRIAWVEEMRDGLRRSLQAMNDGGGYLRAVFAGPDDVGHPAFDIENVLFYNVGARCFTATARCGLRFERTTSNPTAPLTLTGPVLHYARYESGELQHGFDHWSIEQVLASFSAVLPPISSATKVSVVWLAAKRGDTEVAGASSTGPIAVRLALRAPRASPATIIKPLLDGIIASFHAHSERSPGVCERVAAETGTDPHTVERLLADTGKAVLGGRNLVYVRAAGVQWNPADERCVACELRLEQGPEWSMSGSIASAAPMSAD